MSKYELMMQTATVLQALAPYLVGGDLHVEASIRERQVEAAMWHLGAGIKSLGRHDKALDVHSLQAAVNIICADGDHRKYYVPLGIGAQFPARELEYMLER